MSTVAELEARIARERVRLAAANGEGYTEIESLIHYLQVLLTRAKEEAP